MLKRHISTTAITTAGVMAASLLRQVVIYKSLSLQAIGQFAFVSTLCVFIQPLITADIKIFMAAHAPGLPKPEALSLLKTFLVFETVMGSIFFAVSYVLLKGGLPVTRWFPALGSWELVLWCFPISVTAALIGHIQRYLAAKLFISASNVGEVACSLLYLGLLAYFFLLKKVISVEILFLCGVISTSLTILGLLAYLWRDLRASAPMNFGYIPKAIRFSAPGLTADYGGTIVGYFDRLTIGHYLTAANLGLYGFIYNMINMAQVAARSVMDALFQSYYLFAIKNKREDFSSEIMDVYLRWSSLAAFVVLIFFVFYGDKLILLVSRPEMLASYRFFFILWPLFIVSTLTQIRSIYLNYISGARARLIYVNVITVPLTIISYIVGIKYFGLMGACVVSTLTAAFTYMVMAGYSREFHVAGALSRSFRSGVLTLIGMVAINWLLSQWIRVIGGSLIPVVVGGVIVIGSGLLLGHTLKFISWHDKDRLSHELLEISKATA
jgi:O-antigen/teichoic acid export membrane protein